MEVYTKFTLMVVFTIVLNNRYIQTDDISYQ